MSIFRRVSFAICHWPAAEYNVFVARNYSLPIIEIFVLYFRVIINNSGHELKSWCKYDLKFSKLMLIAEAKQSRLSRQIMTILLQDGSLFLDHGILLGKMQSEKSVLKMLFFPPKAQNVNRYCTGLFFCFRHRNSCWIVLSMDMLFDWCLCNAKPFILFIWVFLLF